MATYLAVGGDRHRQRQTVLHGRHVTDDEQVEPLVIGEHSGSGQFPNRRKWSRVRGSNPPLQPYESRPLPYRGPARNW
jgi:hypothetical protein